MICDNVLRSERAKCLAVESNEVSFVTCGSHIPSLFLLLSICPFEDARRAFPELRRASLGVICFGGILSGTCSVSTVHRGLIPG